MFGERGREKGKGGSKKSEGLTPRWGARPESGAVEQLKWRGV